MTSPSGHAFGAVPTLEPLSVERVAAALAEQGTPAGQGPEGALGGWWGGHLYEFLVRGPRLENLMVRARWSARPPESELAVVMAACNSWNSDKIWPKTYVDVYEGELFVFAEHTMDYEAGLTGAQLAQHLKNGMGSAGAFMEELAERFPQWQQWVPADSPAAQQND